MGIITLMRLGFHCIINYAREPGALDTFNYFTFKLNKQGYFLSALSYQIAIKKMKATEIRIK